MKNCAHCDKAFADTRTDRIYCSDRCGTAAWYANTRTVEVRECGQCRTSFTTARSYQYFCSKPCQQAFRTGATCSVNYLKCRYCEQVFASQTKRATMCRRDECRRRHNAVRMRRMQLEHKAETGKWLTDKYQVRRTCVQCGDTFSTRGARAAKYCSNACRAAHVHGSDRLIRHMIPPAWFRRKQKKAAKAAMGTRNTRPWVVGRCTRCGGDFTIALIGDIPRYCSSRCKARDSASRRRARMAGTKITPVRRWYIHERDLWECHICGDPVNKGATAPELDAPVLDHVIALARGGTHSEDNLRTAHFYCNSVKRELALTELT